MPIFKIRLPVLNTFIGCAVIVLGSASLTGCNKAPNEAEITQAYQSEIDQVSASTERFGVPAVSMKINHIEKKSCSLFGNKGHYKCQVVIDSELPMIGKTMTPSTLTLIKRDSGWVIDRNLSAIKH